MTLDMGSASYSNGRLTHNRSNEAQLFHEEPYIAVLFFCNNSAESHELSQVPILCPNKPTNRLTDSIQ